MPFQESITIINNSGKIISTVGDFLANALPNTDTR
jgi:hypothetical protein